MPQYIELVVDEDGEGARLDSFVASAAEGLSRTRAQQLIEASEVLVDGRPGTSKQRLKLGQRVDFTLPEPVAVTVEPEPIPLDIVYEDRAVIVVCKPAGMVTHPAPGHHRGTAVNALLAHTGLADVGGPLRPGIVHRLDRDTSGLLVAAKTNQAYYMLVEQLGRRTVSRTYLALVQGTFTEKTGRIEAPIGRSPYDRKKMAVIAGAAGREAVTEFTVLETLDRLSLVEVRLETGRTHQIRVHLSFIKHPVVGDPVYGAAASGRALGLTRQFLHAYKLRFSHPTTGQPLEFTCPLPLDLQKALNRARGYI